MARPTKSSQRWLNQVQRLSGPLIQMSTGAAFAVVRKRSSLSRSAASARVRLGDVADEGAEHQLFAEADGRDGQLHRELAAVAMQRRHLDALVEHARHAGLDVAAQAVAMLLAVALGNDQLGELAAQRLGARPAEHLLGLGVPAGDHALRGRS